MQRSSLALALALALALVSPLAAAQQTAPVLVERADHDQLVADVDQNATAQFSLFNLNPTDDFYVSGSVDGPNGWSVQFSPNKFFLAPRTTTLVNVSFLPAEAPSQAETFHVTFSLVLSKDGTVTKVTDDVVVASGAPPRILGVFHNPLHAPLDNQYGSALLNFGAWIVLGVLAIVAVDVATRIATARSSATTTREILIKIRRPVFYLVVLYGLGESISLLSVSEFLDILRRFAIAIGVGVFGLYVLYKLLDSVLFYYQIEIAPKTETKMDDVLVPVIRKVGVVVLWVVGIVLTLRTIGWDPTIIFAGAGIAGLVIAFAAQDTMSNLFSGVFLMLDQPFVEGDDVQLESGDTARVESIGLRTTRLYNYQTHESIFVPNNQLATKRIVNHSAPDKRFWINVNVGASYDADPEKVKAILLRIAKESPAVLHEPGWEPKVRLLDFADSSVSYQLKFGINEYKDRNEAASQVRFAIKKAFDAEGIEIPYPQRVVHVRGDEAEAIRR